MVADPEEPYLHDHEPGPHEQRHAEAGPGVVCSLIGRVAWARYGRQRPASDARFGCGRLAAALKEDEPVIERVAGEVRDLLAGFPMPGWSPGS